MSTSGYIGRFAPSPSGPLHFGSLIAALGSYLQARHQEGLWRVRIEDLDPPREMPGAADLILRTLEHYGFVWDGPVVYQSQRHARYQACLDTWHAQGLCYYCACTRAQIQAAGGFYPGTCRNRRLPANGHAVRIRLDHPVGVFQDRLRGDIRVPGSLATEDFILKRRDGLYAYNLAVVLDDADSGITEVVRGADLIETTVRQVALYRLLGRPEPQWLHLPLAMQDNGLKLSKQNHAPALPDDKPGPPLWQAMRFLGLTPPAELANERPEVLLNWGVQHWSLARIPLESRIPSFSKP